LNLAYLGVFFVCADLFGASIKETDVKGAHCFEIVAAPPQFGKKSKSKDKTYVFQVILSLVLIWEAFSLLRDSFLA
jgi:hypothetical protein